MTLDYESLPQRPPRDRKRARPGGGESGDGGACGEPTAAGATAAAPPVDASAGGAGPPPGSGRPDRSSEEEDGGPPEEASTSQGGSSSGDEDEDGGDGTAPPRPGKPAVRGRSFEYLDHTADIQIHSWGATLEAALAEAGLGLFHYMTPITGLAATAERSYVATGHDLHSLLFAFLDELLFGFATDGFACAALRVTSLVRGGRNSDGGGDGTPQAPWSMTAVGEGETFDRTRHAAGTEVKAITYSAMRVDEEEEGGGGAAQVWVIVDI